MIESFILEAHLPHIKLIRDFARKDCAPNALSNDIPLNVCHELIQTTGEIGCFNLTEDYEITPGLLAQILAVISEVDASIAVIIFTHTAAWSILNEALDVSQLSQFQEGIDESGNLPLAFQSYSCLDEMNLPRVEERNGKYSLNGEVTNLVLLNSARYAVIPAQIRKSPGITYFWVNLTDKSVKRKAVATLGAHACGMGDLILDKAAATLVGRKNQGEEYYDGIVGKMAMAAAGISVGIMNGSLKSALEYTNQRQQGGRLIKEWPEVQAILGNMDAQVRSAESALHHLCGISNTKDPDFRRSACAASLHLGQMACHVTADGVQLLGGYGYMKDFGQEKRMRDAVQTSMLLGLPAYRKTELFEMMV